MAAYKSGLRQNLPFFRQNQSLHNRQEMAGGGKRNMLSGVLWHFRICLLYIILSLALLCLLWKQSIEGESARPEL